jgi:hypothetical protein
VTSSLPVEKCELIPQKDCRIVSTLLPSLQPEERCVNVSKEVCAKVLVPRIVSRNKTRIECGE